MQLWIVSLLIDDIPSAPGPIEKARLPIPPFFYHSREREDCSNVYVLPRQRGTCIPSFEKLLSLSLPLSRAVVDLPRSKKGLSFKIKS